MMQTQQCITDSKRQYTRQTGTLSRWTCFNSSALSSLNMVRPWMNNRSWTTAICDWHKTDDILLKFSQLRALGKTSQRDHRTLFNWIWTKRPLDRGYDNFIFHADDFVSVTKCSERGRLLERNTYFEDKIRSHIARFPKSPLKVLQCSSSLAT